MSFAAAPTLVTERLNLRPLRIEDFEPFAAVFASPRSKYMGGPKSRVEAWHMFGADAGQWPLMGFGPWIIERREDSVSVGEVGLNFPDHFPERELGWLLWDGFEGQGYAFEAAQRAQDFAFADLGWDTVVSYIDPENAPSIRLAERLGALPDPTAKSPDDDGALVYRHHRPD